MYLSFGSERMDSRVTGALLVRTISASAARLATSSRGVRSRISQSPSDLSSSQLRSPGFNVKPSRTTIFIIVLGNFRLRRRTRKVRWFRESHRVMGLHVSCSPSRSAEHTSELQSQSNLVCRLLLD